MKPIEFLRRAPVRSEPARSREKRRQPRRAPRSAPAEPAPAAAKLVWSQGVGAERPAALTPPAPVLRNRRRPNIPRILLRVTLLLLIAECAAALLFSPRLWVRRLRVEGNRTVTGARIFERTGLRPQTNLLLLPSHRIRARVEREPAIAHAQVSRHFPDTVVVRVRERTPWATVRVDGIFYTVDEALVPFRKDRVSSPDLPVIALDDGRGGAPRLGKQIQTYGIRPAKMCLKWAASHPDFPLARIAVDPGGKLCLNRDNGAEVRLGTGKDLDKKLNALALLLEQRPDVRAGNFAYINLYAYDAPALQPRAESTDAPPAPEPSEPAARD